jgi:hypothetical protein
MWTGNNTPGAFTGTQNAISGRKYIHQQAIHRYQTKILKQTARKQSKSQKRKSLLKSVFRLRSNKCKTADRHIKEKKNKQEKAPPLDGRGTVITVEC